MYSWPFVVNNQQVPIGRTVNTEVIQFKIEICHKPLLSTPLQNIKAIRLAPICILRLSTVIKM